MTVNRVSDRRKFGRQDWDTTVLGFGSVALGNMSKAMSPADARDLIRHAWEAGIRFFDTAPMYGHGLAELRLGVELSKEQCDSYALVTKVGRTLVPSPIGTFDSRPWVDTPAMRLEYDYSYDGVMRQVEDSLKRMGVERFDVLLVHDTDRFTHGLAQPEVFGEAVKGAFRALVSLREQGAVRAIGLGVNEADVCIAAANAVDVDCILIAGKYSLLDQSAGVELLPLCSERGIAVINGRVFGSGILATGPEGNPRLDYAPANRQARDKVGRIRSVCRSYGVPLGAAAIQFAASHVAIANVCLGARDVRQQQQNYDWFEQDIPQELWQELEARGLLVGP